MLEGISARAGSMRRGAGLLVWSTLSAAWLSGCPSIETNQPPDTCKVSFVGDKSQAPQIQLVFSDENGASQMVTEGGQVPLIMPPQGGRVIYVAARVLNMNPCAAFLTGSIRDPDNNQVRLDARTVNFTRAGDGWGEIPAGQLSSFSNIPACPNQWSASDLDGGTYVLSVSVKDADGRTINGEMHVQPSCLTSHQATECECICKAGYKLGQSCASP